MGNGDAPRITAIDAERELIKLMRAIDCVNGPFHRGRRAASSVAPARVVQNYWLPPLVRAAIEVVRGYAHETWPEWACADELE